MLKVATSVSFDGISLPKVPANDPVFTANHKFIVTNRDNESLSRVLAKNRVNPYSDYAQFRLSIRALVGDSAFPVAVKEMCEAIRDSRARNEKLHFLIRNLPVDRNVPDFTSNAERDPLQAKYSLKKTFIGEGTLEMFSQLTGTPLLSYSTRNNGDFFQDVISDKRYERTQTQKTDGELYPHNDRTAHEVRPDILNLLAMRPTKGNMIPTTYYDGRDLLRSLSPEIVATLREPIFFTPFDDFSKASNTKQERSEAHPILTFAEDDASAPMFRFYSGRTEALGGRRMNPAINALLRLERAIQSIDKYRVNLEQGDLLSIPNLRGLHSRDIVSVVDSYARAQRWLLKSYAFWDQASCDRHTDRFEKGTSGRVID